MAYTNVQSGWKRVKITATGTVTGVGAGNVFGGISCPVVGTTTTIAAYDAITADVPSTLFPATATLTAGQFVSPVGGVSPITVAPALADGVVLSTALHVVFTGTGSPAFWVLYK
jgi:hypothetical protein